MRSLTRMGLAILFVAQLSSLDLAQSGWIWIVSTVAGNGYSGYGGDGGPAISAGLKYPEDVAVDTAGNLFIADTNNERIRKVTPAGVISTVAGTGTLGSGGDGGQATSAGLWTPNGVAVDAAGNLFIADTNNERIRKVTPGGVISTVAGGGSHDPGDGGPATSAMLFSPSGVAVDAAGNLFIADAGDDSRIRKVTPAGIISTVAGNGTWGYSGDGGPATSAQLNSPSNVAVDTAGNLFIADQNNNRIRKVTPAGVISTVAGNGTQGYSGDGGPATSAELYDPSGIAVDAAGNLFIADSFNQRIREVTPGGVISTVAGNGTWGYSGDGGPATSAELYYPSGIAVDVGGDLFIADSYNSRIRKVTFTYVPPCYTLSKTASPSTGGSVTVNTGTNCTGGYTSGIGISLTATPATNYVFSGWSGTGGSFSSTATGVTTFTISGNASVTATFTYVGPCYTVSKTASPSAGGSVTVNTGTNCTGGYTSGTGISLTATPATDYVFSGWSGTGGSFSSTATATTTFTISGTASVTATFAQSGIISTVAGNGTWGYSGDGGLATSASLWQPAGVAVDAAGNIFIADLNTQRVRMVTPSGVITTVAGTGYYGYSGDGGPATSAQLYSPAGITFDTAGNLFIADAGNNCVRKVTPTGVISTVAGAAIGFNGVGGFSGDGGLAIYARLNWPGRVAVDTTGNLFIADVNNNRIRKVTPGGVISTVAGTGTQGFSGDGGPASSAALWSPWGVAVDAAGNLLIGDYGNQRIRRVTPAGVISTVAGTGTQGFSGDGGPATSARLYHPEGIAVDTAGNLFIADTSNSCIRKVTPAGVISTVAGNGTSGYGGDGGLATSAQLSYPYDIAVDTAGNLFIADGGNERIRKVAGASNVSMNLTLGSSATSYTAGSNGTTQTGYATVAINAGAAPYGTAVFSFKQNGVTVSEAGVPASPPTTAARIFIDYRSAVRAIPGRISAGTVNVDTGIAVVNYASATANLTYTLRNLAGTTLATGHGALAAGAHFATFIDQLNAEAPDFVLPVNFQTTIQFGSLDISSDQPISVVALRMTTNQRNEALFTTTPTADLTKATNNAVIFFPQFADGGGYSTSLVLLNTSNATETGTLQLRNGNGNPLVVNQVGGTSGSVFTYYIPSGGAFRFQTDGSPATINTGWAQLTPDAGTSTPIGAGVFGYNPGVFLESESGIPAAVATTHARIYVDLSGGHDTGLAICNPTNTSANITITAFQSDGVTGIGSSQGPLALPANGYSAFFADGFITGLPAGFTGVLDISSLTPFAALTLRSLINERGDFLMTTFPVADMTVDAPSPIVFPQIADGGGYVTQFILIGAGGASSVTVNYYGNDGTYLPVGK